MIENRSPSSGLASSSSFSPLVFYVPTCKKILFPLFFLRVDTQLRALPF